MNKINIKRDDVIYDVINVTEYGITIQSEDKVSIVSFPELRFYTFKDGKKCGYEHTNWEEYLITDIRVEELWQKLKESATDMDWLSGFSRMSYLIWIDNFQWEEPDVKVEDMDIDISNFWEWLYEE